MATRTQMENWLNTAVGRGMNPDHSYGYQCKDVADDYCIALFGDWINTIRPGDAKWAYYNANPAYFDKVANTPTGVPPRGAIICWNGNMGGGFGHIGIVSRADVNTFDVVEQNGFTVKYDAQGNVIDPGKPAYPQHYASYANVIGWLIPKLDPEPPKPKPISVPPPPKVEPKPPAPEQTNPVPVTKIEPVKEKEVTIPKIEVPERLKSRKLWAAVASAAVFVLKGDINAAMSVILVYLGVQGYIDGKSR